MSNRSGQGAHSTEMRWSLDVCQQIASQIKNPSLFHGTIVMLQAAQSRQPVCVCVWQSGWDVRSTQGLVNKVITEASEFDLMIIALQCWHECGLQLLAILTLHPFLDKVQCYVASTLHEALLCCEGFGHVPVTTRRQPCSGEAVIQMNYLGLIFFLLTN